MEKRYFVIVSSDGDKTYLMAANKQVGFLTKPDALSFAHGRIAAHPTATYLIVESTTHIGRSTPPVVVTELR